VRDRFIARLTALAQVDPRIFLITGDLGFGVLDAYAAQFPNQYLNAGVAEQNMTGIATGLALDGRIVFTYSIANFPTLRCLEQLRNDAAYHNANVKVVAVGGGFSYGALGVSHHATEDLAILRAIPNITVVSPGDRWEAAEATEAIATTPGTCYLRIDKSHAEDTHSRGDVFRLGKARVVREGNDFTIIATGGILGVAIEAAGALANDGIQVRIISMHTIRPFDESAVLDSCRTTGGVLTLEEHVAAGGLGSIVAETCMTHGVMPEHFVRMSLRDEFCSIVGSQAYLRSVCGIDATAVALRIREKLALP
jgi:transketolase